MPKKKALIETSFGKYLSDRSVNKAEISRKTGISTTRIARLCTDSNAFLGAYELQLFGLAIKVDPSQMQRDLFGNLKLKEEDKELSDQEKLNLYIIDYLKVSENFNGEIDFNIKDIERLGKVLGFCKIGKTESEILECVGLKRKSSNFTAVLKTCIQASWLTLKQTKENGELVKTYTTTDCGMKVLAIGI